MTDRATWLEWRRQGIGSSDAPAIMTGAWVWRAWLSKIGQDDGADNNAMRRGRYLEKGVGKWASDELGVTLQDAEQVVHKTNPVMRCTPDFIMVSDNGYRVGLEIKTYRTNDGWGVEGTDQIPEKVRWQVDWQMAVCGADRWCVAVYLTISEKFMLYNIRRDPVRERTLIDRCMEWWTDHVINKIPPTLDDSDQCRVWLNEQTANDSTEIRIATDEEADIATLYGEICDQAKHYTSEKKRLANVIRETIGTDRGFTGGGWRLTKSKTGRINHKRGSK